MRTTVLVAVPHAGEPALVDTIAQCGELELVRRCADLPELLSVAAAGLGVAALVGAGLGGLDRSAVAQLGRSGVRVVGIGRPGSEDDERTLRGLGVGTVLPTDVEPTRLQSVLRDDHDPDIDGLSTQVGPVGFRALPLPGVAGGRDGAGRGAGGGAANSDPPAASDARDPLDALDRDPADGPGWRPRDERDLPGVDTPHRQQDPAPAGGPGSQDRPGPRRPGRVVAVWGPAGAPGRSSVALGIASEAASAGAQVLLVDADPYGGVQALALAVLDEAPGLAGAVRSADQGTLDVAGLTRRCLRVAPGLAVLTGLPRADRWPEVRPDPLERVLDLARHVADLVVVDCGFCLEDDEELSYDTTAPRRNAATLTALACADHLLVVGAGEPVGLQRLVRGLQELGTVRAPASRTVVVNRLRESAVGPRPAQSVAAALKRFAGLDDVRFVPDDREAFDRASLQGRTLAECAPHSPARLALADLAAQLLGHGATARRTRRTPRARRTPRPRARH